jgi:peptidoglycan glycosyltransferase
MNARNRELANLVAVGALTALGFASVYIARQDVISAGSISYALIFLGLYVCASFAARLAVPWSDPYLLPLAGLLTAVGLTEIYRLGPSEAFRQGFWIVIGVAAFSATTARAAPGLPGARELQVSLRPLCDRAADPPRAAALRDDDQRRAPLGQARAAPVPAGELAKIALIVFLAGYLREKREVLAQGRLKDFGPLLLIWGAAMLVIVETNDLGSALLYFGIFLAMLYVATGRALFVGIGLVLFFAGAAVAYSTISRVQVRVDCWLHPWDDVHGTCYQTAQGLYAIGNGKFGGTGLGRGTFTTTGRHRPDSLREQRLHLLRARAGARADRDLRGSARLHGLRAARLPGGGAGAGRVLEAARDRVDVRVRAPDVHQRRWGPS